MAKKKKESVTLWDLHEALDRVSMQAAFLEIVCNSVAIKNIKELKQKAEEVETVLGELYGEISSFYCERSEQEERKAYIDRIDFDHQLDGDPNGTTLYPTPEDLLKRKECAEECGVQEVWVTRVASVDLKKISKNKRCKTQKKIKKKK